MYIKSTILRQSALFMTSPRWQYVPWAVSRRLPFLPLVIDGREQHDALLLLCQPTTYELIINMHLPHSFGRKNHLVKFPCACWSKTTIKKADSLKGLWRKVVESDIGSGEPIPLHTDETWTQVPYSCCSLEYLQKGGKGNKVSFKLSEGTSTINYSKLQALGYNESALLEV